MRSFFFFNDTATTEIYTLSLHDALPISSSAGVLAGGFSSANTSQAPALRFALELDRSEEHTSELQSQSNLVCRLLLEKKKTINRTYYPSTRPDYLSQYYLSRSRPPPLHC